MNTANTPIVKVGYSQTQSLKRPYYVTVGGRLLYTNTTGRRCMFASAKAAEKAGKLAALEETV